MPDLNVAMDDDLAAAVRYYASQQGISVAAAMRSAAALVLGYCPACLRPLDTAPPAASVTMGACSSPSPKPATSCTRPSPNAA